MLDQELIEQLKTIFTPLENKITLLHSKSDHTDLKALLAMLAGVASTNNKIEVRSTEQVTKTPQFEILKNSQKKGISFTGIPSGHEFSSLILAILNTDGKGKLPDFLISERIKNFKGPNSCFTTREQLIE